LDGVAAESQPTSLPCDKNKKKGKPKKKKKKEKEKQPKRIGCHESKRNVRSDDGKLFS
jgi:hypothetical protein